MQALRAAARDEAAREAEPVQLGQALIELIDGTDLAGQADLADGGERVGRRLVQRGGGDGDGDGQIGRRLVQPQAADDVQVDVRRAEPQAAADQPRRYSG